MRSMLPDGNMAWAATRQTSGLIDAIVGLVQAATQRACSCTPSTTMRNVLRLIAGTIGILEIVWRAA